MTEKHQVGPALGPMLDTAERRRIILVGTGRYGPRSVVTLSFWIARPLLTIALVELGGGTTDVCVFHERKIRHLTSLPWGGATPEVSTSLTLVPRCWVIPCRRTIRSARSGR